MRRLVGFMVLFILVGQMALAQPTRGQRGNFHGSIYGFVYDDVSKIPIEYANIILFSKRDSSQVTGTVTDKDGFFKLENLRPGRYFMDVDFIGYAKKRIPLIRVSPRNPEVNLKQIFLDPVAIQGEGITVEGERAPVTYQIDKKVINVSKQATSLSGTAVDVLENVPSVNVDIDGNVSLRGSGNFTVLIDDRPTILDPNEVLQQIPASSIENIEIITNPSAKYDPDGVAGIINIVLKKNKLRGISGILNMSGGNNDRYGSDFLVSHRTKRLTLNLAANYNHRNFPGTQTLDQRTQTGDATTFINSHGNAGWLMKPYGVRGSIDLNLGHWDVLSLGGRLGNRSMERSYNLAYQQWSSADPQKISYASRDLWQRSGDFYALNLDYQHKWPQKNHQFSAQIIFNRRTGEEKSTNELRDDGGLLTDGKIAASDGPATGWRLKAEYSRPVGGNGRFEAGYQSRLGSSVDDNQLFNYDPVRQQFVYQPQFSHHVDYTRNIHSLYSQFSSRLGPLGVQLGLRGEYTDRTIRVKDSGSFTIDRWDYFPTLHLSYRLSNGRQFMGSYTRRIRRARGWWLEPYLTWGDAYNVYQGNPGLKPEYVDSYELGHQMFFGKSVFSLDAYYRVTNNKVERVRSVYQPNVMLHTYQNVGKDYALGAEFLWNMDLLKWWNVNYMASIYRYRVEGALNQQDFSNKSVNWSARLNNEFRLTQNSRVQLNLRYHSATVTSQGRSEGFFSTDLAVKQQLFGRKLSLTLQARDLFGTMRHEFTSEGPNFYYYRYLDRNTPMLSVTVSWIFNNYKQQRRRTEDTSDDFGGEPELF